ncbi:helix-turn-helix domain-containing protein [Massilia agilis]|uniref:Helix-turn-helix domain-containing protein n=1 Tax=Massilia agilis TaxID=1811226 RepID=A0ABT2DEE6_9BURK|nr:helix-turn-helix domain-containing protein [Massilia agilis]MCS0809632.1 helix-turn-helix domain-containing protein [Massilia agilis]
MTELSPIDGCARGVVAPTLAKDMFRMARYAPPPHLAPFLEHYWIVEWDLRERPPYVQRTLPYPSVHIVFDTVRTGVFGVTTGAFDYELRGHGKVCGLKFLPGAFRPFLGRPLHTITDRVLPLSEVLGWDDLAAQRAVLDGADDPAMIAAADALLCASLPQADPQVERIGAILRCVQATPGMTQVEDMAAGAGLSVRSLQQLFSDYVGVSPKWTIRRYRLHEAADRLANGEDIDLTALALSLGYFDQAHFTSDFRKLVGKPPGRYREQARGQTAAAAAQACSTPC